MKEYKDLICDIIVVKIDGPRYKDFMNHYDYVLEFIFLIGSKVKKLSDYDIYLQIMNDTGGLLFDYANIRAFVQDAYVKQCN